MFKKLFSSIPLPFVFIVFLVFLFTFLVPPFQKPDEPVHFYWTMALASGKFQCKSDGVSDYVPVSESVYAFPERMSWGDIVMRPDNKFPIGVYKERYPFRNDTVLNNRVYYCALPVIPYVPHVLGVWLSLPFDNLLVTFYCMRTFASLFFLIVLFISYRIIPSAYRKLFLWCSAIPMLLHQVSAVSYDTVSLSLSLLLFSIFISCLSKKKTTIKYVVMTSVVFIFTFFAKSGYIGLAVVPLILFFRLPFIKKEKRIIMKGFAGLMILFVLLTVTPLREVMFQSIASYQHRLIMNDPFYFLTVFGRTLWEDQHTLITGLFGTFGWLEYGLPMGVFAFFFAVGSYVVYELYKKGNILLSFWENALILFAIAANVICLFYIFYINETPLAYKTILGFQGRYFLQFLPFFIFSIVQFFLHVRNKQTKIIIAGGMYFLCIAAIGAVIFIRYYDFSKNFSNPDELKIAMEEKTIDMSVLESIPITEEKQFVYEAKFPNYKIGGFQILIPNEFSVAVPYRFTIKDRECKKILREGYLDDIINANKKFLKGEHEIIYKQFFTIMPVPDGVLCVTFSPVEPPKSDQALELLGQSAPILRFLYIAQ